MDCLLTDLFNHQALATALSLLHQLGDTTDVPTQDGSNYLLIDAEVNRICADPWNARRMKRCLDKSIAGAKPPPVTLVCYGLGGELYFSVSDGLHRVSTARLMGHTNILARVSCIQHVWPWQYKLWSDGLWLERLDSLMEYVATPPTEVARVVRWLIEHYPKPTEEKPWKTPLESLSSLRKPRTTAGG